jgi:hypothetical protein
MGLIILVTLNLLCCILYARLAFSKNSWTYGFCSGAWFLCAIINFIRFL